MRRSWFGVATAAAGCLMLVTGCHSAAQSGTSSGARTPPSSTTSTSPSATTSATTRSASSTGSAGSSTTAALPPGGPVPAGFVPSSVTFANATTAYVLGTAPCSHPPCTSVLRSVDDGAHWVGTPAPVAPLQADGSVVDGHLTRLRFADPLDGYASGGALYTTTDGGASWHRQYVATTRLVLDVETGSGYAWALAEKCATTDQCDVAQLWRAPVGSRSWVYAGDVNVSQLSGSSDLPHLTVVGTSAFVGYGDTLAHATTTSSLVTAGLVCPGSTAPAAIAAADPVHLDAMCVGNGAAGSSQQQLRGSVDGGRGWSNSGPARLGPSYVAGIADNAHGVLVEAASSGASELLRTTDDGASFQPARVSAPSGGYPWTDLGFTTATQGVVVLAGHALYLSHDAGASWTAVAF